VASSLGRVDIGEGNLGSALKRGSLEEGMPPTLNTLAQKAGMSWRSAPGLREFVTTKEVETPPSGELALEMEERA